jgi:hypothetical protein
VCVRVSSRLTVSLGVLHRLVAWTGKPKTQRNEKGARITEYTDVKIDGKPFKIGSVCALKTDGEKYYIAKIVMLFEEDNGETKRAKGVFQWFYWPSEAKGGESTSLLPFHIAYARVRHRWRKREAQFVIHPGTTQESQTRVRYSHRIISMRMS